MEDFSSSGWLSPSVVLHRWKPANGPSLKRRSLVLWIIFGILAWCSAVNCWLQLFWRPWHNYLCIYKYQYYVKSGYYDIIYFICIITQYVYIYIYIFYIYLDPVFKGSPHCGSHMVRFFLGCCCSHLVLARLEKTPAIWEGFGWVWWSMVTSKIWESPILLHGFGPENVSKHFPNF